MGVPGAWILQLRPYLPGYSSLDINWVTPLKGYRSILLEHSPQYSFLIYLIEDTLGKNGIRTRGAG